MTSNKIKIKEAVSTSFIRRSSSRADKRSNLTSSKIEYKHHAPYDEPVLERPHLSALNLDLLSRTEIKVLRAINSLIINGKEQTNQVFIDELSNKLDHPVSTVKKTIQKLEKKDLVERVFFKAGRGGWSVYTISKEIRDKLEIN